MANLKGSTYEKQINNAMARLEARGTSRHGTDSHKTHSNALATKREMYLKDFAKYATENNLSGKLNSVMTSENLNNFLNERLDGLATKTALDYTAGFNSMLKGLEETRVNIDHRATETLNSIREHYQSDFNQNRGDFETNRAISDTSSFLNNLEEIRHESAVIAELQLETGLRVSEALEVANNFQNYYNPTNNELSGIVGKGGQEYETKQISEELAQKISNLENIPSYSTYDRDLDRLEVNSHDLRVTYAKEEYEAKIENGYTHNEALKEVSEELNHHRESITEYYLNRA